MAAHLLFRASALFLVGAFNDDAVYVALGKALAEGEGYRLTYLVGAPVAEKFPPAFPLLLAIPWTLWGTLGAVRSVVAIVHPLALGAAAALIWYLGRRRLALSWGPLALAAVSPLVLDVAIQYYNIPLAEPYFLLGWAAALLLSDAPDALGRRRAVALGLVLAATTLFRSAGVVLIVGCMVALVLRRTPWRVVALAAAVAMLPLLAWSVIHARALAVGPVSSSPDEVSYWTWVPLAQPAQWPAYLARTLWANARAYLLELSGSLAGPAPLGHALVLAGCGAAVFGAVRTWRAAPALVLTTAGSLLLVLIWPFAQSRLILPALPFAGLLAAAAIQVTATRVPIRYRVAVPGALALIAFLIVLRQVELRRIGARAFVQGGVLRSRDESPFLTLAVNSRYLFVLSEWARAHTRPGDRLLVDFPAGMNLYSGRVTLAASPSEPSHVPSVFRVPGSYLVSRILEDSVAVVATGIPDGGMARDIDLVSRACPTVLHREPALVKVYRVVRDEPCLRRLLAL